MQISADALICVAEEARPSNQRPSEIILMVSAYIKLEDLGRTHCGITDDAMDELTNASSKIIDEIIAAKPTSSKDIAAKFRLAASLIEDDDGGMLFAEPEVVFAALQDLVSLRCQEHDSDYEGYVSNYPNPYYGHLLLEGRK